MAASLRPYLAGEALSTLPDGGRKGDGTTTEAVSARVVSAAWAARKDGAARAIATSSQV
jgi:hypothetical protein